MGLKIILRSGATVELDTPDDFNFVAACVQIVVAGYFNNGSVHIRYDAMESLIYDNGATIVRREGGLQ